MTASSSRIRWGILGTARIAARVAAGIHRAEGAQLVAVASRSPERAEAWAAQHGVPRALESYAALVDDPDIDAVYIPLPPSLHREWTIRTAERGKHVLCEKPLAVTLAEAREMAAACAEHGVQLMDGVMWLHHPRSADMLRLISDGALGELRRVTAAFTFCWAELPTNDFRLERALGGGSLLDLGWYCVGAAVWAFGGMPERVFGAGRYRRDVDLNFSGMLWFAGERMAAFDCGFDVGMRKWLEVAGTAGSLVCDDFTRPWHEERPRFWSHDAFGKQAEHVSAAPLQEVCMIEAFCRAVSGGTLNPAWPARAVRTQHVCEALDQSARSGRPVEIAAE